MPKVQKQLSATPGTQLSVSDDFDAEAQARLEELIKQAKISVESKAKAEFQQVKTNLEKKLKELASKKIHLTRTHTEEYLQLVISLNKEMAEVMKETDEMIVLQNELFDEAGLQATYDSFLATGLEEASQADQAMLGCLNVMLHLDERAHAVPPRMTDGRITLLQLDSGLNRDVGGGGGYQGDEDDMLDDGSEDDRQGRELEAVDRGLKSSSKKRRGAKQE